MTDRIQAIREALAAGPTAWDYDSNHTPFYNDIDGNSRGGEFDGTYCLYGPRFFINGEEYEGPVLTESCSRKDAHFIAACNPSAIAALLTAHDAALARAEAVRAEVIEECAKVCDERVFAMDCGGHSYRREASASQCAAAIRSLVRRDGGEKQG